THPEEPGFAGITIAQLSGPPSRADADMKNVVTVSTGPFDWSRPSTWTGVIDRSPCGTGTCARMATLHARGRLRLNEDFRHEGILGTGLHGPPRRRDNGRPVSGSRVDAERPGV